MVDRRTTYMGILPALTERVLKGVEAERRRQDVKWGEQHHQNGTNPELFEPLAQTYKVLNGDDSDDWTRILLEEVYEALAETDPEKLEKELFQVAAVVVAWIEDIYSHDLH